MVSKMEKENSTRIVFLLIKIGCLVTCLYVFVISLELLSSGLRLIGGRFLGETDKLNKILDNKIAGLMAGIVITVLVQSSSTSTSIVVSIVSAKIISVKAAIPVIMGANIGTSITSTFVSFSHITEKESFERAFAGAIVHDIFNVLSVAVLLPLEYAFSYLERVTGLLVSPLLKYSNEGGSSIELLSALTKPLTSLIIQLDDSAFGDLASGNNQTTSLIKQKCGKRNCNFLLKNVSIPEWGVGVLLAIVSLVVLCLSLLVLVKILNSIFFGNVATYIKKFVNSDFPGVFKYFTGYVFILIGAGLTLIIQSSSVFTSTLTPLVGVGIVTIERVFPLVLGSNIGTTITGILAALSSPSRTLYYALQIALCHTFFNISGILIWFPLPFMRKIPINLAKKIGRISGKYRWFGVAYILIVFFFVPLFLLAISFAGNIVFLCVFIPVLGLILLVILVNILQSKKPNCLPTNLQTWDFLPEFLHSLRPYDNLIKKIGYLMRRRSKNDSNYKIDPTSDQYGHDKFEKDQITILLDSSNLYKLENLMNNQLILLKLAKK